MPTNRIYQSESGDWIVSDGTTKRRATTEQEAQRMAALASRDPYEVEWERTVREQVFSPARQIMNILPALAEDSQINGLAALVEATAPGAYIGDSTISRESAMAVSAMLPSFQMWLTTELVLHTPGGDVPLGITPAQLLRSRKV
jgi:hypothetical protein